MARIAAYEALVRRWNPRINLVAPSTLADLRDRHVADSAQLFALAPPDWRHWADLGSGAGFPGLVVAILAAQARPAGRVALVESDRRKAAFLATVRRELGLDCDIHADRIERLAPLGADIVTARALAPLDRLLPLARRHLRPGGTALFPKGARGVAEEIAAAQGDWSFDLDRLPSRTSTGSVILRIGNIERV